MRNGVKLGFSGFNRDFDDVIIDEEKPKDAPL